MPTSHLQGPQQNRALPWPPESIIPPHRYPIRENVTQLPGYGQTGVRQTVDQTL